MLKNKHLFILIAKNALKGFSFSCFLGMMPTMQFISIISRYFILVVLSFSLLIIWYGLNIDSHLIRNEQIAITPKTLEEPEKELNMISVSSVVSVKTIWKSIAENFSLDHQTNRAQVQTEIRKLLANRTHLYEILQAANPYIHFIYKTTKEYSLPAELALIPFVESEFNPYDKSHRGASGLWQLMPRTAKDLGVKIKGGYDGRRNVVASTNAALTYFNDLITAFKGDWYLAIAAYNAGPQRIITATKKVGSKNFWQLRLPKETKLYIPRLLAVAAIVENPGKYGVELPEVKDEPYFKELIVTKPVTLDKMAKTTGANLKTLKKLNPDIKNQTVSQKDGVHKVLVPVKH